MAQQRVQRRLAAILAADVVGYSRLMATDETGTLAALKALRRELIDPRIAEHGGRIVKLMGDGALVEFASVVDAVECAVAIQHGVALRNADTPEERRIVFRIGINLGDIIIDGDDIYGDGVNLAARLESLAEPGGICISSSVREQVRDKVPISFADLGERSVKNIEQPIHVFCVVLDGPPAAPEPETTADGPGVPDKPSIAVLPFANMSGDPEQEFFADGIAEDIITGLSRLRWLFVIARNSSFSYKGRNVDIRQVGRELGVRYVLEGSVRKGGDRIRITGQLIEAETGNHLWAERYDRALDDLFAVQDEITDSVIGCLQPELYAAEHERLKRKPPRSLDAWESFVRGMFLYSQHSDESTRGALELLGRAIELDAGYAQALGLRAVCRMWRAFQGWEDISTAVVTATDLANRAVACDPHEPWAHLAQGFVAIGERRNLDGIVAFSRAVGACPNFAYAHGLIGAAYALSGRPDEAMAYIDRGLRLSPRDIFGEEYQLYYAFAHFQAGRYAEAAAAAQLAVQQRPGHPNLYIMAAAACGLAGETERARSLVAQIRQLVPDISATAIAEDFIYERPEDRQRLAAGLRAGGLAE
jgi:TolB-like protein/class 3 adenylate cyclase/Flp pilus assembly protein TadD